MSRRQKKKQISRQRKLEEKAWENIFNYYLKVQWGRKGKKWRKNTRHIIRDLITESARKDKNEQATKEEIKETN